MSQSKNFCSLNDIIQTSFKFKEDNMRKVELSLKEKYEIIKKLVETNGNKERALFMETEVENLNTLYLANLKMKSKCCILLNISIVHKSYCTIICIYILSFVFAIFY